jgi:hypothetical protein
MTDGPPKDMNPVSPLGKGETERTLTDEEKRALKYPGTNYPETTGRRFHRFPKVPPPDVGSPEEPTNVIHLSKRRPKGGPPGGAA